MEGWGVVSGDGEGGLEVRDGGEGRGKGVRLLRFTCCLQEQSSYLLYTVV